MVEMTIFGLAVDEKAQSPVLILKDESQDLALPIWIGPVEAMAISLAINGVDTPRPMTHDLVIREAEALGASVHSVEIISLSKGTFYAELVLLRSTGGKDSFTRVDCRPSDAVAVAARAGVRILVAEAVLAEAGTRTLKGVRATGAADAERDKWTDELDNLSPDDVKYKM